MITEFTFRSHIHKHPYVIIQNIPMFYTKTSGCFISQHPDVFIIRFSFYVYNKLKFNALNSPISFFSKEHLSGKE